MAAKQAKTPKRLTKQRAAMPLGLLRRATGAVGDASLASGCAEPKSSRRSRRPAVASAAVICAATTLGISATALGVGPAAGFESTFDPSVESASEPTSVIFGIDAPIVVDRDFKVVDLDNDGTYDWLNHSPMNANLQVGPPPGRPDALGTPRFEWDLTPSERASMRLTRIVLDITSSENHGLSFLTISVAGTVVDGVTGGTEPGRDRTQIAGTDITEAVHAWIDSGEDGPLQIDLLESSYSVLTREFSGSRYNVASPPRLFLLEPTDVEPASVALFTNAGHFRHGAYGRLDNRARWTIAPTMAERNTLFAAQTIELQIRRTSCPIDASGNSLLASYENGIFLDGAPGENAQIVASNLEAYPNDDGHIYVDVTEYVKDNIDHGASVTFELVGSEGAVSCKFAMGLAGNFPWYPTFATKLAFDGDRPEPQPSFAWQNGQLGSCRVTVGSSGIVEVRTSVESPDVDITMHRRQYRQPIADWPVGTVKDFGAGTQNDRYRYRAVMSRGQVEEVVICGSATSGKPSLEVLLRKAEQQLTSVLAQQLARGNTYAAWDSRDPLTHQTVRVVVSLADPGTVVASTDDHALGSIINPLTDHRTFLATGPKIEYIRFSVEGAVLGAYRPGQRTSIVPNANIHYGTSPDELLERLAPSLYSFPWYID